MAKNEAIGKAPLFKTQFELLPSKNGNTFMAKKSTTRLSALEAATNTSGLSPVESALLVTVLARRDALFWPWRFQIHSKTPFCEIKQRQREYLSGTCGVAVKADGASNWKLAHEQRQRMIAGGLLTATHSSGQVQSVFLTLKGEAIARSLVGSRLWTLQKVRPVLAVLQIRSSETSVRAVRESVLFGIEGTGDPSDWNDRTEMILPLLTSGLVTCHSDTQGRACYTPVDGIPEPEDITVDGQPVDELDALYIRTFDNERAVLEMAEPRSPDECYVPLPATGWGWPCYFPEEQAT